MRKDLIRKLFVVWIVFIGHQESSMAGPHSDNSSFSDFQYRSGVFARLVRETLVPMRERIEKLRIAKNPQWKSLHEVWSKTEGNLLAHFLLRNPSWAQPRGVNLIWDENFSGISNSGSFEPVGLAYVIESALEAEREFNGGSNPDYGKLKWLKSIEFRIPGGGEADAEGWSWVRYEPSQPLETFPADDIGFNIPICRALMLELQMRGSRE